MKVNQIGNESILQGEAIANENHRFRWINFDTIAASTDAGCLTHLSETLISRQIGIDRVRYIKALNR